MFQLNEDEIPESLRSQFATQNELKHLADTIEAKTKAKVCSINIIENTALVHPVFDTLLQNPDKTL